MLFSVFSGSKNGDSSPDLLLRRDKLNIILKHYVATTYGNIVVAAFTAYILSTLRPQQELFMWFVTIVLLCTTYIVIRNIYSRQENQDPKNVKKWARIFTLSALICGTPWSYAAWFFIIESQPQYMAFMAVVLMGMAAGAIGSNSGYFPAFIAYAVPFMLVMSLRFFSIDTVEAQVLSFLIISLTGGFIHFAYLNQNSIEESLHLRYENTQLLEQLAEKNDALSLQNKLAEEANRHKSQFLANASHDLRQPLQALTLFSEILSHQITTSEARESLSKMGQSIEALNSLLNALLDISQLEAGDVNSTPTNVNSNDLFLALKHSFLEPARIKGIELTISGETPFIYTDQQLLKRCLSNLIVNAINHSDGSTILIESVIKFNDVIITITDNGKGIPKEEQNDIFNEFHQLDNPERDRQKGLGLGLAIVKQTCQLLGHRLTLESSPNHGSKFSIRLPLGEAFAIKENKVSTPLNSLENKQVLVIDDEKNIREALSALLSGWGIAVTTAANEKDINVLIAHRYVPDAIISDYRLPNNTTGAKVIDTIRKTYEKQIPAMLVTGDTAKERINEARETGLYLLHKPVQPARLRMALTKILDN